MPHKRLHQQEHQDGGIDELNVQGLSGVLADRQDANKIQGRDVQDVEPNEGDVLVWDAVDDRWEPQSVSDAVCFGSGFAQVSDDNQSSTTGTTWVQKLRLALTSVPSGTYRISWYYEYNVGASNTEFLGRVQLDDATNLAELSTRVSPTTGFAATGGFCYKDITSGSANIDIDFACAAAKIVRIRRARLEVWRVC